MLRRDPMVDVDDGGLPPRKFHEVYPAIEGLKQSAQRDMHILVARMDEDFWDVPRKEQILMLLINRDGLKVTQTSIAEVMDVANSLVTKIKHYYEEHPDEVFKRRGLPSKITPVFDKVVKFIDYEMKDERCVTLGVLKEFMATLHVHVRRKALWQYLKNNNYTFVSGVPTENTRVEVMVEDLLNFYRLRTKCLFRNKLFVETVHCEQSVVRQQIVYSAKTAFPQFV